MSKEVSRRAAPAGSPASPAPLPSMPKASASTPPTTTCATRAAGWGPAKRPGRDQAGTRQAPGRHQAGTRQARAMLQFLIDTLLRTTDLALIALGLSMLYGLV